MKFTMNYDASGFNIKYISYREVTNTYNQLVLNKAITEEEMDVNESARVMATIGRKLYGITV